MSAENLRPEIKLIRYKKEETEAQEITAIGYARFSTENQLCTSTKDQLSLIRRTVSMGEVQSVLFPNAIINLKYDFKDDAISGFGSVGRDGLEQSLALLRSGAAQMIIVADFKRLARGMGLSLTLFDYLLECKAELYAVSDGFSSAMKNARLQFMSRAYQSEEFLEAISIDSKRGLDERRFEGYSDGHLWFGVGSKATRQIQTKGRLKDSYFDYFIVEENSKVVLRIFEFCKSGHSQKEIAKILNSEGILPPRAYGSNGKPRADLKPDLQWRDRTIYQILNNKAYLGIIERGRTKLIKRSDGTRQSVDIPREKWLVVDRPDLRIVPQDLWDAVQNRFKEYNLKKFQKNGGRKPFRYEGTTSHPLTSLCTCAECGGPIVVITARRGGYYGCRNSSKTKSCKNNKLVSWKNFELPLLHWIVEQLQSDSLCAGIAARYNELRRSRSLGENNELEIKENRLKDAEEVITNIVRAVEMGSASEILLKRLAENEREKGALVQRIKYLRGIDSSEIYVTPALIKQRFAEVPALLQRAPAFEVNRALKPLFGTKDGVRLERRSDGEGGECYWVVGVLDLGHAITLSKGGSLGGSIPSLQVLLELKLS